MQREVTYELVVEEFKKRYCNMQDINRHAYDRILRGDITMSKEEYREPHRYLAAFQDVARATGAHSGDHLGVRRKFLEGLDAETAKAVQWKGEVGQRMEVDNMEDLYSRTENLIRTRALTVVGQEAGGRGLREPIKSFRTEAMTSPGGAQQQDNRSLEEHTRQVAGKGCCSRSS